MTVKKIEMRKRNKNKPAFRDAAKLECDSRVVVEICNVINDMLH